MSRASMKQEYEWVGGENGHLVAVKSRNRETTKNVIGGMSIVGGLALGATVGSLEATGVIHMGSADTKPAIEQHGDHHGSTGMPSEQHLSNFAAEHDIHLNQQ